MGIFLVFSVTSFVALTLGRADRGGAMDLTLERSGLAASAHAAARSRSSSPRFRATARTPACCSGSCSSIVRRTVGGRRSRGADDRLHAIGATATLLVFAIWLATSYTTSGWRVVVAFTVVFAAFYRARAAGCRPRAAVRSRGLGARAVYAAPRPAVRVPGDRAHRTGGGAAAGSVRRVVRRARGDRVARAADDEAGLYFVAAFFAVAAEASWSATHLVADRLGAAIVLYAAFGAVLPGRAARLAARIGREMYPRWGGGALLIASLALLLFLAAGPQAAAALWGLALLLAILNAGLFIESASGAMPLLSVGGRRALVDRARRLVGRRRGGRRRSPVAARARRPDARHARRPRVGARDSARAGSAVARLFFSFRHGVYLALVGQFFLFFVAQNPQWAAPPWPLFGALAVMTLAMTAASLKS